MMKTVLYEGDKELGELEVYFDENRKKYSYEMVELIKNGMKMMNFSKPGDRCRPIAVLHMISSSTDVCFKMIEYRSPLYVHQRRVDDTQLFAVYSACLRDNKTIVIPFQDEEIHLVAMRSRRMDSKTACFWGFSVARGLYEACLGMLNLRCLGIVFDLDETLVVANTLRSFEDKIQALQRRLSTETDSQRIAGMMAEVKRYQDDKAILKQYAETDQVVDNGKLYKIQAEIVPALSDNHQTIVRPLIRLQEKNIVLTRVNPQIRDTSVLVRLRPAWEELRSYLTARGRKRFEVYVCTMAERDYAFEMWRLLDPDSNLINAAEFHDRIVSVKPGSKKSLSNVFQDGVCHPKMALVVDDRLNVWDDQDQPRVHVVPPFAPYYAPQAEANNAIPVLCVARNVACNVRGGFFKEFDDVILQRMNEVSFEDDFKDVPSSPDVRNYLVSEDDGSGLNGNKDSVCVNGMADAEVERRLKEAALASSSAPLLHSEPSPASVSLAPGLASCPPVTIMHVPPTTPPQPAVQTSITDFRANMFPHAGPLVRPSNNIGPQELGLHNSPPTEEGEVPESELDPDTRRRLLILQHGNDVRHVLQSEPSFPARSPLQAPVTGPIPPLPVAGPASGLASVQVPGPGLGPRPWMQSRGSWLPDEDHMRPGPLGRSYPIGRDSSHIEKEHLPPFTERVDSFVRSDRIFGEKQRPPRGASRRDDRFMSNHLLPNRQSFKGDDLSLSRSYINKDFEAVPERGSSFPESPSSALHDIAMRVGAKVEFRMGLVPVTELRFFTEAYFSGERIGEGTGSKRREALHRAAEAALINLAGRYFAHVKSGPSTPQSDSRRSQSPNIRQNPSDSPSPGGHPLPKEEAVSSVEPTKSDDSISALEELEGVSIDFTAPSTSSASTIEGGELHAEAPENVLASLESMHGQLTMKRPGSPRTLQGTSSKRLKLEYPEVLQGIP
ncbi:hypothetical protein vseg_011399 [Gypsophila vaccaria]